MSNAQVTPGGGLTERPLPMTKGTPVPDKPQDSPPHSKACFPPMETWRDYHFNRHVKVYIPKPRLPPIRNKGKFTCRRIWRVVSMDGTLSDAYFGVLHSEYTIIAAIFFAMVNSYLQYTNSEAYSAADYESVLIHLIWKNIIIAMIVCIFVGFLKKMYLLTTSCRTDKQDINRRIADDFEDDLKRKQEVFTSRAYRLDSADDTVDAREVMQALYSNQYYEITGTGIGGVLNRFLMYEDNKKRQALFGC